MIQITFSSIVQIFNKYSYKDNKTELVKRLLDIIVDNEDIDVVDAKGNPYTFDSKTCLEWFRGEEKIYGNIIAGALKPEIINNAEDYIYTIIEDLIGEEKQSYLVESLRNLFIEDTTVPKSKRDELEKLLEEDEVNFIAQLFLYSFSVNNQTNPKAMKDRTVDKVERSIEVLLEMVKKLPKPATIIIPDNIAEHEVIYVEELLKVFAEDAGVTIINKNDLYTDNNLIKYKNRFDRHRKDYFAAESIRESLKDTKLMNEVDYFEKLKDDTYDAIAEVSERKYSSGMDKLQAVMTHVTQVELNTLIARIPDWIKNSEKKGVCHMLVNDKRLWWIDE